MAVVAGIDRLGFVALEITGRCQLSCTHCYSSSGPHGDHGTMTLADWRRVLDEAADIGVARVQLIGGEPTLHPGLPELVRHATCLGLAVEVFSNLARPISTEMWILFGRGGVSLATSYYAVDATIHDSVTGLAGSHRRTRANIAEAVRRGIAIRVGVIAVDEDHCVDRALSDLKGLGVVHTGVDRVRRIGRGGVRSMVPTFDQLCGRCGAGKLAVAASGEVWPCTLARWLAVGNVHTASLAEIYRGSAQVRTRLVARSGPNLDGHDSGGKDKPADPPDPDSSPCQAPVCFPPLDADPK